MGLTDILTDTTDKSYTNCDIDIRINLRAGKSMTIEKLKIVPFIPHK